MFGYVRPPLDDLPKEEAERFRRIYCGLCHTLKRRYGSSAQFILNYDFTYLAILLSAAQEDEIRQGRCIVSPVKKREYFAESDALTVAADESVILAYWQMRDGVSDHDFVHGAKYRAGALALERAYRKAAKNRPAFDAVTRQQLEILSALEKENCALIDRPSDVFAQLLSGAAAEVEDPVRRRILEQLLYHMGRWVYLIDAADDLKKDVQSGNYNPVALRYGLINGEWTPQARREFVQTLDHSVHMMTTAFELWDFGVWTPILEKTLYTGLFRVGKAVLDGTYQPMLRGEDRKKRKNGEEST